MGVLTLIECDESIYTTGVTVASSHVATVVTVTSSIWAELKRLVKNKTEIQGWKSSREMIIKRTNNLREKIIS